MNQIQVLDVTLRDGGCVNNFNFGEKYMEKILASLEASGVNYIELGYIDESALDISGRTKYCNGQAIQKYLLHRKKKGIKYVAMIDLGKFDIDHLEPRSAEGIDGIRLAFHKENYEEAMALGRKILCKGYEFFLQPMVIMRYTDEELLNLIHSVNTHLSDAHGFYIVDSFGEMRGNDIYRVLNLIDHNLTPGMLIGYHSHNNLQLAYSNAITMITFLANRNIMIDVSVMGMGKGAGNLNTELLLEYLNIYYHSNYEIEPLMTLIDQVINVIHKEFYWGYSVEYYLSAIKHCTPSYAAYFYNKHMLPVADVAELLDSIEDKKKISFDKEYAETLYVKYNEQYIVDDSATIERLNQELQGKRVLIIAPGKSIVEHVGQITSLIAEKDVVSITLNHFQYNADYVFITRKEQYNQAMNIANRIIVPTNVVHQGNQDNLYIIDYKKWICQNSEIKDASGVMVLSLINTFDIEEVILAGYDGFSADINNNYFNKNMRIGFSSEQAEIRNSFYKNFIKELKETMHITFLTPSIYE